MWQKTFAKEVAATEPQPHSLLQPLQPCWGRGQRRPQIRRHHGGCRSRSLYRSPLIMPISRSRSLYRSPLTTPICSAADHVRKSPRADLGKRLGADQVGKTMLAVPLGTSQRADIWNSRGANQSGKTMLAVLGNSLRADQGGKKLIAIPHGKSQRADLGERRGLHQVGKTLLAVLLRKTPRALLAVPLGNPLPLIAAVPLGNPRPLLAVPLGRAEVVDPLSPNALA